MLLCLEHLCLEDKEYKSHYQPLPPVDMTEHNLYMLLHLPLFLGHTLQIEPMIDHNLYMLLHLLRFLGHILQIEPMTEHNLYMLLHLLWFLGHTLQKIKCELKCIARCWSSESKTLQHLQVVVAALRVGAFGSFSMHHSHTAESIVFKLQMNYSSFSHSSIFLN